MSMQERPKGDPLSRPYAPETGDHVSGVGQSGRVYRGYVLTHQDASADDLIRIETEDAGKVYVRAGTVRKIEAR